MSFGIALSGLDAAQSDLNVTANNIANSSTTGFKSSDSEFAELFSASPQRRQQHADRRWRAARSRSSSSSPRATSRPPATAWIWRSAATASSPSAATAPMQYTRAGSFHTNSRRLRGQRCRASTCRCTRRLPRDSTPPRCVNLHDSERRQRAGGHYDRHRLDFQPSGRMRPRRPDAVHPDRCQQLQPVDLDDACTTRSAPRIRRASTSSAPAAATGMRTSTSTARRSIRRSAERRPRCSSTYSNSGALTGTTDVPAPPTMPRSASAPTRPPRARPP